MIQAPAPIAAANPSAIALVWTQVRQALQQTAAIGAWSPSFAAAWLMRPVAIVLHAQPLLACVVSRLHHPSTPGSQSVMRLRQVPAEGSSPGGALAPALGKASAFATARVVNDGDNVRILGTVHPRG